MTDSNAQVRRHKGRLRSRDGWWDESEQVYVSATDYDTLALSLQSERDENATLDRACKQLGVERDQSRREVDGLREARESLRRNIGSGLLTALRNGRQLDMDGCEVGVSRQACEEAADHLEQFAALGEKEPS